MKLLRTRHADESLHQASHEAHADLGYCRRGPQRDEPSEKPKTSGGKMFVQMIVGQRVQSEGEEDVMKFSAVTFTMPDMLGCDSLLGAIIRENPQLFTGMNLDSRHFNGEGSLLGSFGSSSKPITEDQLRLFANSFQSAEGALAANRRFVSDEDMAEFLLKNAERRAKSDNLIEDAMQIFSNPTHGGAVAYRNTEKFGENMYRMEWIYRGGQILTPAPPHLDYKMSVFDESIVDKENDHGDTEFILALLEFIKKAYESGETTILGLQINNTATVGRCGDNQGYVAFANLTTMADLHDVQNAHYAAMNSTQTIAYALSGGATSDGGDIAISPNSKQNNCTGCGKEITTGQAVCSCRTVAQHAAAHSQ